MQRERQTVAIAPKIRGRKEWSQGSEPDHPTEARSRHPRQHAKARRAFGVLSDEAERQIRELRARY